MMARNGILLIFLMGLLVGCGSQASLETPAEDPSQPVVLPTLQVMQQERLSNPLADLKPAGISSDHAKTTVGETSYDQIQDDIANRRWNYLFLHFWRTNSSASMNTLPVVATLHKTYAAKVHFMLISLDADGGNPDRVAAVMNEKNYPFTTRLLARSDIEKTLRSLEPNWNGQAPVTFLFDPESRLLHAFQGAQSLEAYEAVLKKHVQ
ncbi:MAG: hypothetical protein RBU29_03250 [bacterium]|jgi:hypothetical protein|nr:hypothetical protein [bacterium]